MAWILKLRNWQLLILIMGIPIIAGIFLVYLYRPQDVMLVFNGLTLLYSISVIFFLFWASSVGTKFYSYLPDKKHLNLKLFQISIALILFALIYLFTIIYRNNFKFPELPEPKLQFLILLLLVLSSYVYIIFFISKTIKSIETDKNLHKGRIILYMTLLLFVFPLAILIIQPKINQIFYKYFG